MFGIVKCLIFKRFNKLTHLYSGAYLVLVLLSNARRHKSFNPIALSVHLYYNQTMEQTNDKDTQFSCVRRKRLNNARIEFRCTKQMKARLAIMGGAKLLRYLIEKQWLSHNLIGHDPTEDIY
jgi:hypothetical protein